MTEDPLPDPPPPGQQALFSVPGALPDRKPAKRSRDPGACDATAWSGLAQQLGPLVHLGTSSWSFPGWRGLVWDGDYAESLLSRRGLAAYAHHPLLRSVSVDRSFYSALDALQYRQLAEQVPGDFRFVVKAPAAVSDATLREPGSGRATADNPLFLDPQLAVDSFVQPAVQGLGDRVGALVFQLSPLGRRWLGDLPGLHQRLAAMFEVCAGLMPRGACLALEVRDAELLTPDLATLLRRHGVRYCVGLHDRMPSVAGQLPMLRAMWPGPFVCRWNLQRGLNYTQAKDLFAPFDALQAPDPSTREELARIIAGTVAAGYAAYATINNKAEGSAPLSVIELAKQIAVRRA